MSIKQDGQEVEKIVLSEYDSEGEEAMHDLFQEKGFEQLSEEELKAKLDARDEEAREEDKKKAEERKKQQEHRKALRKESEERDKRTGEL
mmetsp:Transcript_8948/g.13531  ORF Transcript_8948/g.13531 Transcript_8948/m.13531 type:complete len:90 (+) Transcript_8948:173-442(+)